ncbi:phage tail protein [Epilithonimonas tenax]|uniref:phage tail protein n=1 Tax=Epilithonimonas tenax TaxID=191577 RepID=UPI0003F876F7|nr:tail fiber protein [Epilithonimonas tenax]
MKKYILLMFIFLGFASNGLKAQGDGTPFLGQIMYVSFSYAPKGWADCNGQLLPINENQALFSLLGTTYGGNGTTTFALPNIQGRVLISDNSTYPLGGNGGEESHTLTIGEMPMHSHLVNAVTSSGNKTSPEGNLPADTKVLDKEYASVSSGGAVAMNSDILSSAGGSQPHTNIQPYVTFKCVIALQGIYPSRN